MTARQMATTVGSPCCNCKAEPCRCTVVAPAVALAGDRPTKQRRTMRRYRMPDGAVLNVDDQSVAAAVRAGAVPWTG